MKRIGLAAAALALAAGGYLILGGPDARQPATDTDGGGMARNAGPAAVAELSLPTVGGEPLTLAMLRGQVMVVNFWATWCPPCKEEIPDFIALQEKYRERGVAVVGVDFLEDLPHPVLQRFMVQHGINYPVVGAPKEVARALAEGLGGVPGLPTTVVLNRNGEIAGRTVGKTTLAELEALLQEVL